MSKLKRNFRVKSLESVGKLATDYDVGIVRISGNQLSNNFERNSYVKIQMCGEGTNKKITRIVRALTGEGALKNDEIALQYDDRLALGVSNAGESVELKLTKIPAWRAIWSYCSNHPSPLIKAQFWLSVILALLGILVGAPLGLLFA